MFFFIRAQNLKRQFLISFTARIKKTSTMNHLNVFLKKEWTIFEFAVTADKNDNGFNLYSLNLTMKLNIPKCQCSITLFTTVCIVGGVTSRSLSQVFLNI